LVIAGVDWRFAAISTISIAFEALCSLLRAISIAFEALEHVDNTEMSIEKGTAGRKGMATR
jgi:hypothetical protein